MQIVKSILEYCEVSGIFARRRNIAGAQKLQSGNWVRLGTKGEADIWAILKGGRHVEIEVKKPGEKPTPEQFEWLRQCAAQGAFAFWCTSLDEFIECIDKAQKGVRV